MIYQFMIDENVCFKIHELCDPIVILKGLKAN